ncbi:Deoxyribonuclease-2, partial [Trichinella nativa]
MQNHLQLLVHFILILFSQSQNPNPKCRANDGNAEGNIIQSSRTDQRQNPRFKERRCMGGWKRGPYTTRTTVVWSYTRTCCRESRSNKIPCIQQCSTKNDQRVIIVQTTPGTDAASWIVHTVPGFPAAKTGYSWPVAENAKGHLLICLTISESQINAIAASLLRAEPLVHYNDIPETETVGMQYFKKLSDGQFPTVPPYLSRQSIKTAAPAAVTSTTWGASRRFRHQSSRGRRENPDDGAANRRSVSGRNQLSGGTDGPAGERADDYGRSTENCAESCGNRGSIPQHGL